MDSCRYDTIILSDVLEHISNPENLWHEISRLLKPGGNIIINTPFFYLIHENPYDYYRYTEFALKRFAKIAKIEIILLESLGGIPIVMADLLLKNLVDAPKVGNYLAMMIQQISYLFLKTPLGEKISAMTKSTFPLEYFLIGKK